MKRSATYLFIVVINIVVINIAFILSVQAQELAWPREIILDSGTLTIYQPQMDVLEKDILTFRAAVSFKTSESSEPVFGAAWFESRVEIDRTERLVRMISLTVTDTRFPEGVPSM